MKISELINTLVRIVVENGDIDVVCVTPGMASNSEEEILTDDYLRCFTPDSFDRKLGVKTAKYLGIGQ